MTRGDRLQTATERRLAKWRGGKRSMRRDTHTAASRSSEHRTPLWYFRAFHHSRTPFTETMLQFRQRSTNAESMQDTVVNRAGLVHLLVSFHWLLSRATVFVEVLMDLLSHTVFQQVKYGCNTWWPPSATHLHNYRYRALTLVSRPQPPRFAAWAQQRESWVPFSTNGPI